jgi:zinc protease
MTLGAVVLSVAASTLIAQARTATPTQASPAPAVGRATLITTVEGVSEYRFPNGLQVLLYPDSASPSISINATYWAGSRQEGYGETGIAHLMEHLLLRSTKKFPDLPAAHTQRRSVRNASTGMDFTNYYETLPASDANLEWALEVETDRMTNATISKENLATEFTVVLNEREQSSADLYRSALNRLMRIAYIWHPYGRQTAGNESDIRNVPLDRLTAFYRKYYQPDNAMLVITGRFDPRKALALVDRTMGSVPRPTRSAALGNLLPGNYTVEPVQDGEHYSAIRRSGDSQWILMGYHIPGVAHPDFAPAAVLADVLFSNPSGRLHKAIVDTRRAATLDGTAWLLGDPSILMVRANLGAAQSLDTVRAMMQRLLDSARTSTYSNEEVTRAKTSLLRNIQLDLNNPTGSFSTRISDWASFGDWRLIFYHRDRLARVTAADVQRVAGLYLKPSNSSTVVVIPTAQPDRAEIPANPNVATMLAGYKGGAVVQTGEAFDPTPRNIEARVTRVTLPSGMHLLMLPKESRGNRVVAQIVIRHGSEASLTGKVQLSQVTGSMLIRGSTRMTRQQIVDSLSKLTSAVSLGPGTNSATVIIETTRPNLQPVLELVAQQLRSPRFDAEELEKLKKERLVQLENGKTNPIALADIAINRRLAPRPKGHPLYRQTADESIEEVNAITVDAVRAYYQAQFGGSAAAMAIVGDFDAAEVQSTVTRLLGDWRSAQPYERLVRTYVPSDSALETIEVPDKPNASFFFGTTMALSDGDPDYPALALAHYIMAGSGSASRGMKRLREKDGITYGIQSSLNAQSLDRQAVWITQSLVSPQNIDRMQQAWREEIDRALKDGFTAEELEQYRSGYLGARQRSRSNDPELVVALSQRRFAGRTFAWDEELEKKIAALTPEQVTAAMRKYFDPKNVVIVRSGSFAPKP